MCSHPERDFPYFGEVSPLLEEALLIPFYVKGEAVGTIWVVSHDTSRRFDREDLRLITNLGAFAAAAYQARTYQQNLGRVEAELHEAIRHSVTILGALPEPVYTTDSVGRLTYYNEAAAEFWGYRPKLGDARWCGSWRLFRPDGSPLPHDECPMAIAIKEDHPIRGIEAIAERPDGTRIPFLPFPTPLHDATGKVIGAVNMLVDISERKSAEEVAQRLALIVESSDDAIISKDLNGVITSWNRGAERLFGYTADEVIGMPVTVLIPPERQEEEISILERIRRGQRIEPYETVRVRKHGSAVDISLTVSPVRNAQGKIIGASKVARDITERKRAEERIRILAREAEHRAKNVLATVQATVHLTHSDTPEGFKSAVEGRIQALANVHRLFVESRWTGADLHGVINDELAAYSRGREARVQVAGPSILLEPNAAQVMAVSLHELATNAAKYGALSVPEGQVQVEWSCARNGRLVLRWNEKGGPPVVPPTRRGFGARVMENMVRGQTKGQIHFDWRAEGLSCAITLPL
jgi:PAS domain S-box-containing protein